jgi:hypothetical protein
MYVYLHGVYLVEGKRKGGEEEGGTGGICHAKHVCSSIHLKITPLKRRRKEGRNERRK